MIHCQVFKINVSGMYKCKILNKIKINYFNKILKKSFVDNKKLNILTYFGSFWQRQNPNPIIPPIKTLCYCIVVA